MSDFSDEVRNWPYSSKPIGGVLLAHWADKIAALEAENERLKQLLYECNETGGIESTDYMVDDDLGLLWPVD